MVFVEEFLDERGLVSIDFLIRRNDLGEKQIITVKDTQTSLDLEHLNYLYSLGHLEAKLLSTRDKLIWFRMKLDQ